MRPGEVQRWRDRSALSLRLVSLLYQKRRDSRIQDRAIDDFTLKGKPRNGSIGKF
jgi:hypothetical protein